MSFALSPRFVLSIAKKLSNGGVVLHSTYLVKVSFLTAILYDVIREDHVFWASGTRVVRVRRCCSVDETHLHNLYIADLAVVRGVTQAGW